MRIARKVTVASASSQRYPVSPRRAATSSADAGKAVPMTQGYGASGRRTFARTSHRLLSIDGGGGRGVVALEVLARIEQVLRDETGDPALVLAQSPPSTRPCSRS